MPSKTTKTPWQQLDLLERRLMKAAAATPARRPWAARERAAIIRIAREGLGIREALIPEIAVQSAASGKYSGITVEKLCAFSWPGCAAAAHLYLPGAWARQKTPLVILCCGHGAHGKQTASYQRLAWRMARMGAAVLVPDNIGQGERRPMGHRTVVGPFRCGLSLQGMIVMETMAWLRWAQRDGRFDRRRIAACGNSGGGTLTLFLGALCRDELAALSSSGYPSCFEFVARKEKYLCSCNVLPGLIGEIEMWQLYGCFAPKPLFLFQGLYDNLFPSDIFHSTCRKVAHAYRQRHAGRAFQHRIFDGQHAWDEPRREALGAFLASSLKLSLRKVDMTRFQKAPGNCYPQWPTEALTADAVAASMTGLSLRPHDTLHKVFCPQPPRGPNPQLARVDFRQLAAQQTAFLAPLAR